MTGAGTLHQIRYASSILTSLPIFLAVVGSRSPSSAVAAFVTTNLPTHHHRPFLHARHHCQHRTPRRNFSISNCNINMVKKSGVEEDNDDGAVGIMMILSPAKTLDLTPFVEPSSDSSDSTFPPLTTPQCDTSKTKAVSTAMKHRSKKDLEKLLGISSNLAATSHGYWTDYDTPGNSTKPAIYSFSGAAYQGLDISTCSIAAVRYMQCNLRIVDPLYGALRPLDAMQPYRLEMATKKVLKDETTNEEVKDLAGWWKPSVTSSLCDDLEKRTERILINVASDEYSAAVDAHSLPEGTQYIKIVFRQEGRVIAVHAKKARGMMVRYLAENDVRDVEGIRQFDVEGYTFREGESSEDTIVFDRPKPPAAAKKTSAAAAASKKKKKTTTKGKDAPPKKRKTRSK